MHDNLRISVTDRCNIRCFYCMPEDGRAVRATASEILDFEEIERFVRVAARLGIRKLRITGGEPLVRRDLPVLIARLAAIPGIQDMALTTNGVLLAGAGAVAVRRRPAAPQRPHRHAGSRALPADHAPRRSGARCWPAWTLREAHRLRARSSSTRWR